jgi:hypothetical protein
VVIVLAGTREPDLEGKSIVLSPSISGFKLPGLPF